MSEYDLMAEKNRRSALARRKRIKAKKCPVCNTYICTCQIILDEFLDEEGMK